MNKITDCKAFHLARFISDHLHELNLDQILSQISKSDKIDITEESTPTGHVTRINFDDTSFILITKNNLDDINQVIGYIRDDAGILRNSIWDK